MNFLDIFFAGILIYAAWRGFKKGFIIELFTFLALFLGLYAGIHFSNLLSSLLSGVFTSDYLPAISFTIIFLAVGAMIFFGGKALEKVIKVVQLTLPNKILGLAFSMLKVIFLLGALTILIESYNEKNEFISEETKEGSMFYYPIQKITLFCIPAFQESSLFLRNALSEEVVLEDPEE